jgi:DNA-binding NarL/FixJ family response regulator
MNQISILFVDKNPLIRKAWHFLLTQRTQFQVMAACESGEMALELAKKLNPDVVIIDCCLRGMSGLETTQLIRRYSPTTKVIGLSYDTHTDIAFKIILSGAHGCLSKMSYPDEIYYTINEVQNGRTYICKEMRAKHWVDVPTERISSPSILRERIITMNKPRLQERSVVC